MADGARVVFGPFDEVSLYDVDLRPWATSRPGDGIATLVHGAWQVRVPDGTRTETHWASDIAIEGASLRATGFANRDVEGHTLLRPGTASRVVLMGPALSVEGRGFGKPRFGAKARGKDIAAFRDFAWHWRGAGAYERIVFE